MTKKTILGQGAWYLVYGAGERTYIATTFTFDDANQLVSSTTDGVTTRYAYDAARRLVREGNRTYRYGYLDKVLSVTDGKRSYRDAYHSDGQLARADYGDGGRVGVGEGGRAGSPLPAGSEAFLWDGLALVRRGDESFVNEPHVGNAPKKLRFEGKPRAQRSARRARKGPRGNPVVSSKGAAYFNDVLGTTVGSKSNGKYSAAALTAFGERLDNVDSTSSAIRSLGEGWFTGKPHVAGLGHAFLFRNYRASLAKWQTADPLGYPDGWNQLAYCGNSVASAVDLWGGWMTSAHDDFFKNSIYYDGRRMKEKYLRLIMAADKSVDVDQSEAGVYKHAMKSSGQLDSDAIEAINGFINGKIDDASSFAQGYIDGLYALESAAIMIVFCLGEASHTYQDRMCPAHFENGCPHTWFDNWLLDWRHFPEIFIYVRDEHIRTYKAWIESVFHSVLKMNQDLINEIFE